MLLKSLFAACAASVLAGCCCQCKSDKPAATAVSPDGKNEIRLWTKPLAYEVSRDGVVVVARTEIGMRVDGTCLQALGEPKICRRAVSGKIETPVYKKAKVDLAANETGVCFGDWCLRLAARNDGVAYRFETKKPGKITVNCEKASVKIPCAEAKCAISYGLDYGREATVPLTCKAGEIKTDKNDKKQKLIVLPFEYSINGKHVAITESDVCDYPVWYLNRAPTTCPADAKACDKCVLLGSDYAKWPKETFRTSDWELKKSVRTGGRCIPVKAREDFLVTTEGTRTFPWRTFILADKPSDFCAADIVFALAREQVKGDFSWVKPGKVAWDWWNCWDNLGEAKGCTTDGYKRFIDFAAKTGVEYVILDEGWSETLNIWKFHQNVDVPEIIRYGNEKGVGIILWMAWAQIYGDEARVASHFAKLGAKGFKVDFMDRGDADVERFLWTFADECAKNKLLVNYHGSHRPTGMSRAYPNVLTYEGVFGLECMKWFKNNYDFMANDVRQFFLRMTAGPMDYTPGAMDNYKIGEYKGTNRNPGSVGTRCHQMAMMAAYESPLQMLSDSPTKYEKNMECFSFMAATPVVWTDTVGLGGCPDSYAAVARQAKDSSWYAAAINNATGREVTIDTAFLARGQWKAEIFRDADTCNEKPEQYVHEKKYVKAGEKMTFKMANGGGFIVRFTK